MFPPGRGQQLSITQLIFHQGIHVLGRATAVFVTLAAGVAAKLSLLGVGPDQVRTFAGTSVPVLGSALVVGRRLFIHGHILERVLLDGVCGGTWAKVRMHAWSCTHRLGLGDLLRTGAATLSRERESRGIAIFS